MSGPPPGGIVLTPTGGLGNRLFQLAAGFAIAHSVGYELAVISNCENGSALVDGLNIPVLSEITLLSPEQASDPHPSRGGRLAAGWRRLSSSMGLRPHEVVSSGVLEPVPTSFGLRFRLSGYFQNWRFVERAVDSGWPRRFPGKSGSGLLPGDAESLGSPLSITTVHVRLGDYARWANRSRIGLLPHSYFREAMAIAREQFPSNEVRLVSDEPSRALSFLEQGGLRVDGVEDAPNAIDALSFMDRSSCIVASNSTFAWWGAFWSRQAGLVIGPRPWNRAPLGAQLMLPEWTTVGVRGWSH